MLLFKAIDNAAASGDTTIVAGKANFKVRVIAYVIMAGGTTAVKFTDGAGGAALTGAYPLAAQAGVACQQGPIGPDGQRGWFETTAGNALVLNSSQAIQVSGHLLYNYVPG